LLRCISCGQLEVSYLNEFESDLFLTHHSVARLCGQCGGWTTWTRPHGYPLAEPHRPVELGTQRLKSRDLLAPGSRNNRSNGRIRVNAVACVRHPTFGSEAVLVGDLAHGGLSFYSASTYPQGERIEIAIPYTSKTPNIYLPARIVGSRKGKDKGLIEYSAAYLA
jgi:hypothetical protein